MVFTTEEDARVDQLIETLKARIQSIGDERRNTKGKKKKEALGLLVIELDETIRRVKDIWDLGFKKESEWTEPILATGTEFKWDRSISRRGDVLMTAKIEGSFMANNAKYSTDFEAVITP